MIVYFKNEPKFQTEYQDVLTYAKWVEKYGNELGLDSKKDTGIDLVATTFAGEHHAIQCKNYVSTHKMAKSDIDSFMSASSKTYFSYRIVVSTVTDWTDNAIDMVQNQQPPVSTISLSELEQSVVDWNKFYQEHTVELVAKKQPRPHQIDAINHVVNGLATAERGKLIMACGTGKTFTSLKIAERMAGKGKKVLFLVPSLALLSQTLNEWTQQSSIPLRNFAVCSDSDVGKKKKSDDDLVIATVSDLDFPATTNPKSLSYTLKALHNDEHMTVVYSTYHSLRVISDAQMSFGLDEFDLIICDEAHRTTGATFDGEDESAFVMVHNNDNVMGKKRLYMTATPRIYGDTAKATESVQLCSMDDEKLYGKELFVINFSQAVALGLLVDYKVVVLAVEEADINRQLQAILTNENNELNVSDASKIVGCWKALTKHGLAESENGYDPMKRAVAFCQVIEKDYKGSKHKVSSKLISEMFAEVVKEYQAFEIKQLLAKDPNAVIPPHLQLACECEHVDGGMNATEKQGKIDWLKQELPDNTCHILSNVRCLSEGVDVPSLDAVMFLTPRQSQIDVVQSVGRVMRLAPNKTKGYVILPVVIPAGVEADEALDQNEPFKVVWQVLNALRSHDDRFDAMINKLELNGRDASKMEVVAVSNTVTKPTKSSNKASQKAKSSNSIGKSDTSAPTQLGFSFEVGEIEKALYAKIVKKVGNRRHWEEWANDIAQIANTHIDRINAVLENPANVEEIKAFNDFANELRDDLNNSISNSEVVEMLAQHLITKPVFDALFDEYDFTGHNPISRAMQKVLDILEKQHLEKETKQLNSFYESVKMRAEGINTAHGKQKIIVELYDKFFRNAFPRMTKRLGIVYTPTEVVDFILHSVENVLNNEFNASLADKGVHILDPFTGTGTFITRLLQSGLIPQDKLTDKYKHEIHANEIVLLAYYIACINIEAVYHAMIADEYTPFNGICLTDTFEMYEKGDFISDILEDNSDRRKRQKELDIRVIIGNPPYSKGQKSANDNNKNIKYDVLDEEIRNTYAKFSKSGNKRDLYNPYIRALKWASLRMSSRGVIGYIIPNGFIDKISMDGVRKELENYYSSIYLYNLRGDIRKNILSKGNAKEGENIFEEKCQNGITIAIFIKNEDMSKSAQPCKIYYYECDDNMSYLDKKKQIEHLQSIKNINFTLLEPNNNHDWVNKRDDTLDTSLQIGNKDNSDSSTTIFEDYSLGLTTNRDKYVWQFSSKKLAEHIRESIDFYNKSRKDIWSKFNNPSEEVISENVPIDKTKISWSRGLKKLIRRNTEITFESQNIRRASFKPYSKEFVYFSKYLNEYTYQLPRIFAGENLLICVSGVGTRGGFSTLIANVIPNLHLVENGQCFPLYLYEEKQNDKADDLFAEPSVMQYERKDAISDAGLAHFADYYQQSISKEDLFYYIYGLLHSEDYREKYADNLSKQLPRIPQVKSFDDFMAFSRAGRALADLHLNYESVDMYTGVKFDTKLSRLALASPQAWANANLDDKDFYVEKMRFITRDDKSKIVYNGKITVTDIPVEAYDYVVNGKSAIEWVMERQGVKTDKASGIVNDANDWAMETMNNARYPLELLLRVITVSLKTNEIVKGLPKLVVE
ncbi:DEAD/DEAH box helicase [Moraxella pluranimalium]|uniref:DEAD/DEAH box helicase n=1 Tax=Moraxella pluranimalium TaxID=470453 RepID=UPI00117DBACC|nr:type ISP restriction/modification enzyme [Moraxella pluranimalium]